MVCLWASLPLCASVPLCLCGKSFERCRQSVVACPSVSWRTRRPRKRLLLDSDLPQLQFQDGSSFLHLLSRASHANKNCAQSSSTCRTVMAWLIWLWAQDIREEDLCCVELLMLEELRRIFPISLKMPSPTVRQDRGLLAALDNETVLQLPGTCRRPHVCVRVSFFVFCLNTFAVSGGSERLSEPVVASRRFFFV